MIIIITKPVVFKNTNLSSDLIYQKGDLFIQSEWQMNNFYAMAKKLNVNVNNFSKIYQNSDVIPYFKNNSNYDNYNSNVIIQRSGGIGDLIALSSISDYILENDLAKSVIFNTQKKYKDLFDWFKIPVEFHDNITPFKNIKFSIENRLNKNYKSLFSLIEFEGKIENQKDVNWYEIFFNEINPKDLINFNFLGVPKLKQERISQLKSNIPKNEKTLLLSIKATANIRSISLESIFSSLPVNEYKIYIHSDNLTKFDNIFIEQNSKTVKSKINIIKADSLYQYLLDLYDANLVFSVDSASVHFREAIHKPCIGIYAPFTTNCRTKYYKYTKNYNIKSDCQYQPCFKHCNKFDEKCLNYKNDIQSGICLNHKYNKTLKDQLYEIFKENI